MQFSSALLETAVNEFAKLPGIGKKTALRLVLHLLKQDPAAARAFGETILKMRQDIRFCQRCHNVADADICSICANSMRRKDMICVVETIRDVIAIESTQQFSGTYHVLGGSFLRWMGSALTSLPLNPWSTGFRKKELQK